MRGHRVRLVIVDEVTTMEQLREAHAIAGDRRLAKVARCQLCGAWAWDGRCTTHPAAPHDTYGGDA